jgi:hypothetical protein
MFGLFSLFFAWMVVHDLRTGEIGRGWRHPPTTILAKDPAEFYVFVAFLSLIPDPSVQAEPRVVHPNDVRPAKLDLMATASV